MGATETKDRGISWERLNDRQKKFVEEYLNYQAWNAGMKALTGKNNATFSDLAPNL